MRMVRRVAGYEQLLGELEFAEDGDDADLGLLGDGLSVQVFACERVGRFAGDGFVDTVRGWWR
jgi:hypothetical protein